MSNTRLPLRALRCALAAASLLAVAAPCASATDVVLAAVPGESFSQTATTVAFNDSAAEGGRAQALYSGVATTASVKLTSAATSFTVRARGSECAGAPSLQLLVDGASVAVWSVTTNTYVNYAVTRSVAAGTHTLTLRLTNDYMSSACDRNLFVDTVRALGPAAVSAPTTPSSVTAVAVNPKLRWAPPALTTPATVNVAQGDQVVTLDKTKDYILNLGTATHLGALSIAGGRNVVLKGGAIALPATSTKNTALVIKDNVGTVHVEGVLFDGTQHEMDAIQIVAPSSTVQVENVRAVGLLGSFDTNHSDVIQPYGGVAKLRVDHLSADSNYQGIFTRPDLAPIGSVELQDVDLAFDNAAAGATGGYLLWMTTNCKMAPTTLSNFYIAPRTGTTVGTAVWPATNDSSCPSKQTGNGVTFPRLPVTGGVIGGAPPAGAFVPAGKAGVAYTSPGYQ
ncbi:MAG TPA: carbohydrate-binding domain-containing protein [Baekduia sp.]